MNIYRLEETFEGGGFGGETVLRMTPACVECGLGEGIGEVELFSLYMSHWGGGDLLSCPPEYAVTDRLASQLKSHSLTGFSLESVSVEMSEDYIEDPTAHGPLPKLHWLRIHGVAEGPPTNHTFLGVCRVCERDLWKQSFAAEEFIDRLPNKPIVSRASWNGDDLFRLREPGNVIVTERFLSVISSVGIEGFPVTPADWI